MLREPTSALLAPEQVLFFHGLSLNGLAGVFRYDGPIGSLFCSSGSNSTGDPARIAAAGSSSVAANNLTLNASALPPQQLGLFYAGSTTLSLPLGNGIRCIGGAILRFPPASSSMGGCLTLSVDITQLPATLFTPGTTWHFQAWFADPAGGGSGVDLTNGVSITFEQ